MNNKYNIILFLFEKELIYLDNNSDFGVVNIVIFGKDGLGIFLIIYIFFKIIGIRII